MGGPLDPYDDSDAAYAATPLESPTAIPTFHNCPRVRFQPPGGNRGGPNSHGQPPFQYSPHQQGPLRYDPQHGLQPQAYPAQPGHHGQYGQHGYAQNNPYQQQRQPHHQQFQQHQQHPPQQLMRPLIPPVEFLDQHLDVFQTSSYELPEDCFRIESGPPATVDLDLFCIEGIVNNLLESKKKLRAVPQEMFGRARQRCNPYELVGSSIFMNRASVKLASIDSQLALTATKESPTGTDGANSEDAKTFRFADLCSGPGGFSEYLLWRKHTWGERARGWAMTLKGDLDFQLDRFHKDAAVQETLHVFYGKDGTGDILKQENIDAFSELIEKDTHGLGVGLVSADGGISVDGDEAVQETLLQRLILCQILTMFMTLQKGGDFVVKIFDIFTPVTAGLVWILSRHFEKICVVKPLTSRPMNSERYVVCRRLLDHKPSRTIDHLKAVNAEYQDIEEKNNETASPNEGQAKKTDVNHIIDPDILTGDAHFMEYIKRNNMKTAIRQTEALDVFLKYVNEGLRPAFDQEAIKKLCLQEWRIPPRPQPYHPQQQQHQQQQQQQQQQRHPHQQAYGHPPQRHGPSQAHGHHHLSGPSSRHHPYQQAHHHSSQPYPTSSNAHHQHQGPRRPSAGSSRGQPGLLDSLLNNMQAPPRR
ncbi:FtsJ methyltransferase domain-containing protein 2 [Mortierella antarctica]|nr:FtsJ methyltransferase domain-containing protein 2 [Mortierella antarctica]